MTVSPNQDSTIAAIATAKSPAGIAIIRLTGPMTQALLEKVVKPFTPSLARKAQRCHVLDHQGRSIDDGLCLFFPGPHSYTGEDVGELHLHGNPVICEAVLQTLWHYGAEPAKPGEFTQRAFLQGKMDLIKAEAVCDMIQAQTLQLVRAAKNSMQGVFSRAVQDLQRSLEMLRIHWEAAIDFSDQDFEAHTIEHTQEQLMRWIDEVTVLLQRTKNNLRRQQGLRIAMMGAPNAGKSTLLNHCAQESLAIVTAQPGTTRDSIQHSFRHQDTLCHIIDTAGLRETDDSIENMGIQRSLQIAAKADIIWWLVDSTQPNVGADTQSWLQGVACPVLMVYTKQDLLSSTTPLPETASMISAATGYGVQRLLDQSLSLVPGFLEDQAADSYYARARHCDALQAAKQHAESALTLLDSPELMAEELRLCQQSLSLLTGQYHHEDLLSGIFSHFCLGK